MASSTLTKSHVQLWAIVHIFSILSSVDSSTAMEHASRICPKAPYQRLHAPLGSNGAARAADTTAMLVCILSTVKGPGFCSIRCKHFVYGLVLMCWRAHASFHRHELRIRAWMSGPWAIWLRIAITSVSDCRIPLPVGHNMFARAALVRPQCCRSSPR